MTNFGTDTVIENLPAELHDDRQRGPGDSPATVVADFVAENPYFKTDRVMDRELRPMRAAGWRSSHRAPFQPVSMMVRVFATPVQRLEGW